MRVCERACARGHDTNQTKTAERKYLRLSILTETGLQACYQRAGVVAVVEHVSGLLSADGYLGRQWLAAAHWGMLLPWAMTLGLPVGCSKRGRRCSGRR